MGLESLRDRRWCGKLCLFYKVLEKENRKYIFSLIPTKRSFHSTRNIYNILRKTFFPATITEWNNLDPHLRKSESFLVFKSNILKFIRPSPNSICNCHNPGGICLITIPTLGLGHLTEHKFKHGLQDTLNPLCTCGNDAESAKHFLLHYPQFFNEKHSPEYFR